MDSESGKAEYTYSASNTSTLTQTNANMALALTDSAWYELVYTVNVTLAPDGDFAMTLTSGVADAITALPFTAGTKNIIFQADASASSADFVISTVGTTDTQGQFDIDDISLKRIGLVAHCQFNSALTDRSGNALTLTGSGDPTYTDNNYVQPIVYEHFNPHSGTIAFYIKPDWDGDDGENHYIFYDYTSATNYILIKKSSANNISFIIEHSDVNVQVTSSTTAWTSGTWYNVVCSWNEASIDGTDYIHLYINGSEVANSTTALGIPGGVEASMDFLQGDNTFLADAVVKHFTIDSVNWKDTIANAETAGLAPSQSAEWFNSLGEDGVMVPTEATGVLIVEE